MNEISLDKLKIGFEIHAQMNTKQKLYCDCPTDYQQAEPNRNVCPVCIGLPGNKPMPVNEDALKTTIEIALMLDADVIKDENIYIQRKHYNYPDLPNGYQKTSTPIAKKGKFLDVGITEVHLEDDPGRYDLSKGKVDFNRCGVPLIEIVTDPDIKSVDDARSFWNEITDMLTYTGKIRSEPGTIRSDTNISMGGERVEIKNINSAIGVYHALQYEVKRQLKAFRRGREIKRETRGFLEDKMITTSLRTKETFADYRYIPDPDIPPIVISNQMLDDVRKHVKESPKAKEERFIDTYRINREQAKILAYDKSMSDMFEKVSKKVEPSLAASWLTQDVRRYLTEKDIYLKDTKLTPSDMIDLLKSLSKKEITPYTAKDIFKKSMEEEKPVNFYLKKVSPMLGKNYLERIVEEVISRNEDTVSDYKLGNRKALNYLVGEVMREAKGTADPKQAFEIIKRKVC
jgi:aspartyl-tRNA(Asn)/glutamyl-tRNA(Gln) amidotransferase subunit B